MRSSLEDISQQKRELRKQIKEKFCSVFAEEASYKAENSNFSLKENISKNVLLNLEKLSIWQEADIIFAFSPLKDEVDISFFTEAAYGAGKKVALPRITGDIIDFCFINPTENLIAHKYGMKEPSATAPSIELEKENFKHLLILVPGLAFDSSCNRLGRGKSFYDRFLSQFTKKSDKITTAAIAFSFQIVDKVPIEEHDIILDYIITEDAIYGRN